MIDSGIILRKHWLEVNPEEQTRRLKSRIDDGRKIWKLTSMDLSLTVAGMTTRGRATPCSLRPTLHGAIVCISLAPGTTTALRPEDRWARAFKSG